MKKILPHLAGRRQFIYTAKSKHYSWSTVVTARTVQEARRAGYGEALKIFGNHAPIHSDEVTEHGN